MQQCLLEPSESLKIRCYLLAPGFPVLCLRLASSILDGEWKTESYTKLLLTFPFLKIGDLTRKSYLSYLKTQAIQKVCSSCPKSQSLSTHCTW